MEFDMAKKVHDLVKSRDRALRMRAEAVSNNKMRGWSFMVDDNRFPIATEIKNIFLEAIDKSIDYYENEIGKL